MKRPHCLDILEAIIRDCQDSRARHDLHKWVKEHIAEVGTSYIVNWQAEENYNKDQEFHNYIKRSCLREIASKFPSEIVESEVLKGPTRFHDTIYNYRIFVIKD